MGRGTSVAARLEIVNTSSPDNPRRLGTVSISPRQGEIFAHGVHLTDDEVHKVEQAGIWLVHNPRSNKGNKVGYARSLAVSSSSERRIRIRSRTSITTHAIHDVGRLT